MSEQQRIDHERVRRELWAATYQEAHRQSAARVQSEFRYVEAADYALAAFDKRFGTAGVGVGDDPMNGKEGTDA